jgi:phage head maturation protease
MALVGYAVVFGKRDIDGRNQRFKRGCFDKVLRSGRNIFALWNHDWDDVIGSTDDGTLRLKADHRGLRFELPGFDAIPEGFNGCSYHNAAEHGTWLGEMLLIEEADLMEVSLMVEPFEPAFPDTRSTVRVVDDRLLLRNRNVRRQTRRLGT